MKILNSIIYLSLPFLLACNGFSNKKTPLYKIPETPKNVLAPVLQNQFNRGVDFIASGKEIAEWKLEMNFDDSIRFVAQDGLSFTIPAVRQQVMADSSLQFNSSITLGKIVISIKNGACNNIESLNNEIAKECTVSIGSITYSGCGQFLFDNQLEGKWNLQQYKNVKIEASEFKSGIPYLKFSILNNRLSGYDGCNTISGEAAVQGKRIQFSAMASTKKLCNNLSLSNPFSVLNNQLTGYKINNGLLYLYLIDDSVLIFKKTT